MNNAGRVRLQKADAKIIGDALEARGYSVRQTAEKVEAWCPDTGRYLCGFYWQSKSKSKAGVEEGLPACWRFDVSLAECFSLKDLKTALHEISRVQRIIGKARAAWQAFVKSRSDKRWMEYRGFIAAIFLRHDINDEE